MLAQLMDAAEKDHVQLSRSGYAQGRAIPGLMEVSIDAALSGPYTDTMHFINDIERDRNHVFFIINGITLKGPAVEIGEPTLERQRKAHIGVETYAFAQLRQMRP